MNLIKKLNCVLLIDDDEDCNFFHKRVLNKLDCVEKIHVALNGLEGLDFLRSEINGQHPQPAIIFLDINMPVMDGWEFLREYEKLEDSQKAKIVLVMLTTSLNPDDREKAKQHEVVSEFKNKYLDQAAVIDLIKTHFPDHIEQ